MNILKNSNKYICHEDSYLVIELTEKCILKCSHCIQSKRDKFSHFDDTGFINVKSVIKLFNDLKDTKVHFNSLILFWLGEPLMHPEFINIYNEALKCVESKVFNRVEVHTNAVLLNKQIIKLVTKNGKSNQQWHFSLDAASPLTYSIVKGVNYYNKAVKNTALMLKEKSLNKAVNLKLVFQFIIRASNIHEADKFGKYWKKLSQKNGLECVEAGNYIPWNKECVIFYRRYDHLDPQLQKETDIIYEAFLLEKGLIKQSDSKLNQTSKQLVNKKKNSESEEKVTCSGPFKSPVISRKGDVTVCTRDSMFNLKVGNINNDSFIDIWWKNKRLSNMRKLFISKDYSNYEFCISCSIPFSSNYTMMSDSDSEKWQK